MEGRQEEKGIFICTDVISLSENSYMLLASAINRLPFCYRRNRQLLTKPDKPAIAPAIRGFPFVNVHKGEKVTSVVVRVGQRPKTNLGIFFCTALSAINFTLCLISRVFKVFNIEDSLYKVQGIFYARKMFILVVCSLTHTVCFGESACYSFSDHAF